LKFRPNENEVFYFISVTVTITDLQAPEILWYIHRGAKWNDVKNVLFSSSKCEKRKSAETQNQVVNRLFIDS
jgi:hypothetical protein